MQTDLQLARTLTIERVNAALGAVVSGVDLREPLTDEDFATIHGALVEHQVLFFRDQDLDDDQQRAFVFGGSAHSGCSPLHG